MRGGGGSSSSVIYTNLIPTYIPGFQDWAVDYMTSAAALQSAPNYTPYPDPIYAAQNADETDGIAALATRGRYGSQVELDGKAYLRDLYDGLKIATNSKIAAYYAKKIEALLQEFDEDVLPQIRNVHVFAFGGSDHNVAEAKAAERMMIKINEIATMFYDDYRQERSLQEHGLAFATPYGLQCIRDMEMLRLSGVYAREYLQGSYDAAWQQWDENEILNVRNLDILGNATRTILATYRQTTTKYAQPSAMSQIAGIALVGLSLYTMFSGTSVNPFAKGMIEDKVHLDPNKYKIDTPTNFGGFNP